MNDSKEIIRLQQEMAASMLDKLAENGFHCTVVGGAPRNWFYGMPARDIDVMIVMGRYTDVPEDEILAKLATVGFDTLKRVTGDGTLREGEYPVNQNGLRAVYEQPFDIGNGVVTIVQLLHYDSRWRAEEHWAQYPLSASQVAWNGTEYMGTDAFNMGNHTGLHVYTGRSDRDDRYVARIQKACLSKLGFQAIHKDEFGKLMYERLRSGLLLAASSYPEVPMWWTRFWKNAASTEVSEQTGKTFKFRRPVPMEVNRLDQAVVDGVVPPHPVQLQYEEVHDVLANFRAGAGRSRSSQEPEYRGPIL